MQVDNLSWFPGHMTKTRRMITAEIKNMDAVCEILDARIPLSSRNPDVDELTAGKPRLVVLNRVDQADPGETRRWAAYFRGKGYAVLEANAKGGAGTAQFAAAVRELLRDKLAAWAQRGQAGRTVRVMVLGIPNVGKSTFINKVARRKTARAEDRPGVTRSKQWVPVDSTLELLDTPGILWPRFDDPEVGKRLAFTGAIKDDVVDMEELACYLMDYLGRRYAPVLEERYKIDVQPEDSGYDLLEKAGRKRGFRYAGGPGGHPAHGPGAAGRIPGRQAGPVHPGDGGGCAMKPDESLEQAARQQGYAVVCGCDEAGAGPLMGPVCAGAVILPPGCDIPGLDDSKKLTEKKRETLYTLITERAIAWAVASVSAAEIDATDILSARIRAMALAIEALTLRPDYVLIDGNRDHGKTAAITLPHETVIGGDGRSVSIAAASILAKVTRDRYVTQVLDREYPQYLFAQHKGYGTKLHYAMLDQYGPCPEHRQSFLKKWKERQS